MKTGPFSRTTITYWPTSSSLRKTYRASTWYRTKPVRSEPTAYSLLFADSSKSTTVTDCLNAAAASMQSSSYGSSARVAANNRAYAKFRDAIQRVDLGTNLAERRQAINMIALRANQLRKGFDSLRRGDLGRFCDNFGISPKRGHSRRSRPQDASRLWLEYHFGWSPLLGDIYDAVNLLQSPFSAIPIYRGRSSYGGIERASPSGSWTWTTTFRSWRYSFHYQARVYCSNPNLMLANQLGLVNPISLAWELVPFSFLVDWFIPVGQFLNSFTDFIGLEVKEPFTTEKQVFAATAMYRNGSGQVTDIQESTCVSMTRVLSITRPILGIKAMKGLSVSRGATAISLLITSFLK